jgi:hypothetical protein
MTKAVRLLEASVRVHREAWGKRGKREGARQLRFGNNVDEAGRKVTEGRRWRFESSKHDE